MTLNFSGFLLAREEHNASFISDKMQSTLSALHITMYIKAKMSDLHYKISIFCNTSKEIGRLFQSQA